MYRVLKDNGSIYLQMDTRINHWMRILMDDVFGYDKFQTELIWMYNSQGKTNKTWNRKHDHILFYTKTKNFTFNANDVKESITDLTYRRYKKQIDKFGYYTTFKNGKEYKYYVTDGSLPKDVFTDITYLSRSSKELTGYPTQKPLDLLKRLILASSNENEIVADFFMGSGSTLVAAKQLNRQYIGCDTNQNAVDITNNRLNNIL